MPFGGRDAEDVGLDGGAPPGETRLGIFLRREGGVETGRRGLVGGRIDGHFGGRGRGNGGGKEGTDEQESCAGPSVEEESSGGTATGCGHLYVFLRWCLRNVVALPECSARRQRNCNANGIKG